MKSFLFSQLAAQLSRQGPVQFAAAHPNDWLVWEPGTWRPPLRNQGTLIVAASQVAALKGAGGEALAFALVPKPGREGQLAVGRAESCEISINDATLSQTHLVLTQLPTGWTVRDAGSSNGSWLNGVSLAPGKPMVLSPGSQIRAAQVGFTFLNPSLLLTRIQGLAPAPRPPQG